MRKSLFIFVLVIALLQQSACGGAIRIPNPNDPPRVKARTDILNKGYRVGLVAFYFRAAYVNDSKIGRYIASTNSDMPYDNLSYYYPDTLPLIGAQFIEALSQNTHFTLVSGPTITQSQAYLDAKPSRMHYITANLPGYKIIAPERDTLAELARKLGLDAVMVVHIFPQSLLIIDGVTVYTHQYIDVVDQHGQVILSSHIGKRADYYMKLPYDLDKTSKLMLNSFELGLAELQQRMDALYSTQPR